MSGSGLHRHGKRKARKFHWRRNLWGERIAQSQAARGIGRYIGYDPAKVLSETVGRIMESSQSEKPKHWANRDMVKPTKGFLKRLFNRKTGG